MDHKPPGRQTRLVIHSTLTPATARSAAPPAGRIRRCYFVISYVASSCRRVVTASVPTASAAYVDKRLSAEVTHPVAAVTPEVNSPRENHLSPHALRADRSASARTQHRSDAAGGGGRRQAPAAPRQDPQEPGPRADADGSRRRRHLLREARRGGGVRRAWHSPTSGCPIRSTRSTPIASSHCSIARTSPSSSTTSTSRAAGRG